MSRKIIGVTVGSPLPKPNLEQTDPSKGDYVKGREIIPTKVSDLDNDVEYLTASDIPVQSVNGKTGAVSLGASDVGARPNTWTPTYSEVGAEKSGTASSTVSAHNTNTAAHNDIRLLIEGLTTRINALANSTDEDLDQMAEIVAYIKANKTLIDSITTTKVNVTDIVNNLTTNVSNKPLSAAQGVALKALIDALDSEKLAASELTTAINTALAQAKAGGEFDGEDGYTPVKGTDYWTADDIAAIEEYIDSAVTNTFGQGTSIPSGSDLNTYTTIGKYYANANAIAQSLVNSPTSQNFMMYVFVRTTDAAPSQLIIDLGGKMYLRSRSTSSWGSWVTYITKTDLDAKADKSEGVVFIEGSGTTDSTAKTSTWVGTSDRITEYYDGLAIRYKIGVAGQSTVTLNINNLGEKIVYRFNTTKLTTQFPAGSIITLIYHEDLNDGCWITNDYDANTNTQQRVYKTTGNVEYPITTRYAVTTGASYYAEYGRYSEGVTLNPSTNTITAAAFKGALKGNADTATKATQDGGGNNIASTYAKKADAETWTFTLEDGSTVTKKVVLG